MTVSVKDMVKFFIFSVMAHPFMPVRPSGPGRLPKSRAIIRDLTVSLGLLGGQTQDVITRNLPRRLSLANDLAYGGKTLGPCFDGI
jgi:hypothetical protein